MSQALNTTNTTTNKPYRPSLLPTLFDLDDLRAVLEIDAAIDTKTVQLSCIPSDHGSVLGSQLVAQQIVLAERTEPGKRVQTLQTQFVRGGRCDRPLEVEIVRHHAGRSFAFLTMSFVQEGMVITTATALLTVEGVDARTRSARRSNARSRLDRPCQ